MTFIKNITIVKLTFKTSKQKNEKFFVAVYNLFSNALENRNYLLKRSIKA